MAITIDIMSGDLEQGSDKNKPAKHTTFICDLFGKGFSSKTITDNDDPDTWTNVYFYSSSMSMDDIASWDELGEYANENEVYINIYDHDSKERKGYWYDEDQEWLDMDPDSGEEYEANAPK